MAADRRHDHRRDEGHAGYRMGTTVRDRLDGRKDEDETGPSHADLDAPLCDIGDAPFQSCRPRTNVYLAGTMQTQHDAMKAQEKRLAAVQRCATEDGMGQQEPPEKTEGIERTPNKTAGDGQPTIT